MSSYVYQKIQFGVMGVVGTDIRLGAVSPSPFCPFFITSSAAMFDALSKVEIHNSTCRADICCVALLACLFTEPNIFSFSRQDGLTAAKRYRFDKQHFKRIFYSLFCVGGCIGPL